MDVYDDDDDDDDDAVRLSALSASRPVSSNNNAFVP